MLFLKKTFRYYEDKFKERKLIVEINQSQSSVFVVGREQSDCMQGKTTVKNILESMICFHLKGLQLSAKDVGLLEKYFDRLSKYPIHLGRAADDQFYIISKDTILKQFLTKPKFIDLCKPTPNTKFGILLLNAFNKELKFETINNICRDHGFTLLFSNFHRYFKKAFVNNEEEDQTQEYFHLLAVIAETFSERKEKFELIQKKKR